MNYSTYYLVDAIDYTFGERHKVEINNLEEAISYAKELKVKEWDRVDIYKCSYEWEMTI